MFVLQWMQLGFTREHKHIIREMLSWLLKRRKYWILQKKMWWYSQINGGATHIPKTWVSHGIVLSWWHSCVLEYQNRISWNERVGSTLLRCLVSLSHFSSTNFLQVYIWHNKSELSRWYWDALTKLHKNRSILFQEKYILRKNIEYFLTINQNQPNNLKKSKETYWSAFCLGSSTENFQVHDSQLFF